MVQHKNNRGGGGGVGGQSDAQMGAGVVAANKTIGLSKQFLLKGRYRYSFLSLHFPLM